MIQTHTHTHTQMSLPINLHHEFFYDRNVVALIKKFNTFSTLNEALNGIYNSNKVPLTLIIYLIERGADNLHDILKLACKYGHIEIVKMIIIEYHLIPLVDYVGLACEYGHEDVLRFIWNHCKLPEMISYDYMFLKKACKGGNKQCVDFLVDKGCHEYGAGIQGAYQGGHDDIKKMMIDLMIKKTKTLHSFSYSYLDYEMIGAAELGHKNVVDEMLEKGATRYYTSLVGACRHGHVNVAKNLFELVSSEDVYGDDDINYLLFETGKSGNISFFNTMVGWCEKKNYNININFGFVGALSYNRIDSVRYMLGLGVNLPIILPGTDIGVVNRELLKLLIEKVNVMGPEWNHAFAGACQLGDLEAVKILIEAGAQNLRDGLIEACIHHKIDLAREIVKMIKVKLRQPLWNAHTPNNNPLIIIKTLNEALDCACQTGDICVVRMLLKEGANDLKNSIHIAKTRNYTAIVELILSYMTKEQLYQKACDDRNLELIQKFLVENPHFVPPKFMSLRFYRDKNKN